MVLRAQPPPFPHKNGKNSAVTRGVSPMRRRGFYYRMHLNIKRRQGELTTCVAGICRMILKRSTTREHSGSLSLCNARLSPRLRLLLLLLAPPLTSLSSSFPFRFLPAYFSHYAFLSSLSSFSFFFSREGRGRRRSRGTGFLFIRRRKLEEGNREREIEENLPRG